MDPSAASAPPPLAGQLQPDGDVGCSARCNSGELAGPITSLTESEEDQFRRLEEEILAGATAGAAAAGPARPAAGARSAAAAAALLRRGHRDRRWQQRILAVAAFKTEGQRRRVFEEDILSVAASVCSEMGSIVSGSYSLDESLLQSQQARRLTQNASGGTCGGGSSLSGGHCGSGGSSLPGHGRWSAPVCGRSRGVFTEEDEDVMNLIMGQTAHEAAS